MRRNEGWKESQQNKEGGKSDQNKGGTGIPGDEPWEGEGADATHEYFHEVHKRFIF